MQNKEIQLTPAQQRACDNLLAGFAAGQFFVLWGAAGMGKTTILRHIQAATGGIFIDSREVLAQLAARHPLAIEEAFLDAMRKAMASNDTVIVDDVHLITNVVSGCGNYPRPNLFDVPAQALL